MGVGSGIGKFGVWGIRFFQLAFAIILLGTFAWFHHQLNKGGVGSISSVDVPLGFSVAAVIFTTFSIITVCCMQGRLQTVAAILDFILFVGYLASCILYRHNYSVRCSRNALAQYLIYIRDASGRFRSDGDFRNCNLVRLGAALLVIQTILFFISMIMSFMLARSNRTVAGEPVVVGEKRGGRFGFGRGGARRGHTSAV